MISGGGTGGHIYPAISIAQALKDMLQSVEILFVGAKGKMEMKKVPEAGFEIEGLWISGIQRKLSTDNLMFPFKLLSSIRQASKLIKKFKPDAVVGVGGYASGPLLYVAGRKGIPTLIQEQNSYAGLTNKWLSKSANTICVAHEGMEKYFPANKIVVTGNPVRKTIKLNPNRKAEAFKHFELDEKQATLLVIGGSLGARTLNESVLSGLEKLEKEGVQLIWQCGGFYKDEMEKRAEGKGGKVVLKDFILQMDFAYACADVVISRAGALSIAELMLTAKPSILVPSPNVAEDHQTINALALVDNDAAEMVKDSEAMDKLIDEAMTLLKNKERQEKLSENIGAMAHENAAIDIANEVMKLVE
ncbi:UDP-N-acetylglucosamine-N-acetylmuramylpentapeptide N-acetylglucosamine transferase [Ekhidna lutea]|uniref:UDP-N-acetylglucosamine--N-acetylmuramyl-(pentapeptide) pyrophosphoryl-undecaprenol N-acetylglucosamine transferase n=1 Tax=Ekhidna lutea TaxID=447679 RepID=A0A239L2G5_EKHLU|nr:undecaprenyldiphospho-muramoylpentapeptide beta-N-acetylglucosaminyltransferase [Ekhidna lutea]SNT24162.1 UDP-N-acetylglucosamine-N-acetylmuramylpentapeptide N-acetylglucosamine transferase [Ekhidna lutea]